MLSAVIAQGKRVLDDAAGGWSRTNQVINRKKVEKTPVAKIIVGPHRSQDEDVGFV